MGASASAIESLNKILISNKTNDSRKEIKQMDIDNNGKINLINTKNGFIYNYEIKD